MRNLKRQRNTTRQHEEKIACIEYDAKSISISRYRLQNAKNSTNLLHLLLLLSFTSTICYAWQPRFALKRSLSSPTDSYNMNRSNMLHCRQGCCTVLATFSSTTLFSTTSNRYTMFATNKLEHNGHASTEISNGSDSTTDHTLSHAEYTNGHATVDNLNTELSSNGHCICVNGAQHDSLPAFEDLTATEAKLDAPIPTENGGYSHTHASKAKISAANKGKTPWNKGKQRSEQVRAKIAAGVRARNREKFLSKLAEMGLTEEEYEKEQLEKIRKKEQARKARMTENGGYRPTDETRKKISRKLKEKYAKGEVKARTINPENIRRGFTHSEETRRKISESLRRRWADDEEYRNNMVKKATEVGNKDEVRLKISQSLKEKWQDPEFRNEMLEKISSRKPVDQTIGPSHRERISQAMKLKWQDEDYRNKSLAAIAKRAGTTRKAVTPRKRTPRKPRAVVEKPKVINSGIPDTTDVYAVRPMAKPKKSTITANSATRKKRTASKQSKRSSVTTSVTAVSVKAKQPVKRAERVEPPVQNIASTNDDTVIDDIAEEQIGLGDKINGATKPESVKQKGKKSHGSVQKLREERRDLYDLLYGDDDGSSVDGEAASIRALRLGDEDLDKFDPYGLDDF